MAQITALVTAVEYRGTTRAGNPTYDVTLSVATAGWPGEVTLATASDVSIAYGIGNPEYADVPHLFTLDRSNRIESAVPAGI